MAPPPAPAPLDPARTVLCVPTPLELARLRRVAPEVLGGLGWAAVELLGFGPVAAAARGALLAAAHPGRTLLLVGIAGRYPDGPGLGAAAEFGAVRLDGLGAGEGAGHLLPSAMGLAQWSDGAGDVHEELGLGGGEGPLLVSVCAAAAAAATVEERLARHPGAAAEDMEAFGLALALRAAGGPPPRVVRGVSNLAGDRDVGRWRIDDALAAAAELLGSML